MCGRASIIAWVGVIGLVAGCGEAPEGGNYPSARLEGEVSVDGQPVGDGTIQFVPQAAEAGPVTQATVLQGRYIATKVPLGKVNAIPHVTPPAPPAQMTSEYVPPKSVTIPARYQSGFPIEVKGDMTQDFPMSTK